MAQDPTREEMMAFLQSQPFANEFDDFDREEAIYWFAVHTLAWRSRKRNLYSVLSTSTYRPSPLASGPQNGTLYEALEIEFTDDWFTEEEG